MRHDICLAFLGESTSQTQIWVLYYIIHPTRDIKRAGLGQNRSVKTCDRPILLLNWFMTALIRMREDYGPSSKNRLVRPDRVRPLQNWH